MSAQPVAVPSSTLHPLRVSTWTCYTMILRWNLGSLGPMLPLVVVVQALLAAGVVIGFGMLIPNIDADTSGTALFLSTGAPTVLLMTVGLVIVPQAVSMARANGTFTYLRSLPVHRGILLAADLTMWLAVALPGVAVAVVVARLRFDLTLDVNWPLLVSTSFLVTLMATSVGYAIAVSLAPTLAQLLTQILVFFVMLFSPVTFPVSQLPGWFQTVHDWLPVRPAADLLRSGLASQAYVASARDLVVLLVWTTVGLAITLRALTRRA